MTKGRVGLKSASLVSKNPRPWDFQKAPLIEQKVPLIYEKAPLVGEKVPPNF
jgi:hypothetical protein